MILGSDTVFQPNDYFCLKAVKFLRKILPGSSLNLNYLFYYLLSYFIYFLLQGNCATNLHLPTIFTLQSSADVRAVEPAQEDLSSLETQPVSANTLPQCEEVADNVLGLQILRRSVQDLVIPVKEGKDCLVLQWYKVYSDRRLIRLAEVRTSTQPQL